jgi:hypothetical protein
VDPNPDLDLFQNGKSDPDPDWHQNDADPQNWNLKGKVSRDGSGFS